VVFFGKLRVNVYLYSRKKRFTNYLYKTSMKKKPYEKPSIEVVELKQTRMLMASGDVENYQIEPEREW